MQLAALRVAFAFAIPLHSLLSCHARLRQQVPILLLTHRIMPSSSLAPRSPNTLMIVLVPWACAWLWCSPWCASCWSASSTLSISSTQVVTHPALHLSHGPALHLWVSACHTLLSQPSHGWRLSCTHAAKQQQQWAAVGRSSSGSSGVGGGSSSVFFVRCAGQQRQLWYALASAAVVVAAGGTKSRSRLQQYVCWPQL